MTQWWLANLTDVTLVAEDTDDHDYHGDHDDLEDPDYHHNPDHYRLPGASCIAGSMVNEQMDYGEV